VARVKQVIVRDPDCIIGGRDLAIIADRASSRTTMPQSRWPSGLAEICADAAVPFIFKASYDKANRTSVDSDRGPGWQAGLETLARVREKVGVPVLSDVHDEMQVPMAMQALDVIQIPAFLSRQTDLWLPRERPGCP